MFGEFIALLVVASVFVIQDIAPDPKEDPLVRQQSAQEKTKAVQEKKESIQKSIDTSTP